MWDPETGRRLRTLTVSNTSHNSPRGLAFSPDGKRLACVTQSGQASLWNLAGGEREQGMPAGGVQPYIHSIAYSPDGKWVVTGGGPGVINSGTRRQESRSVDGPWLAAGADDYQARIWRLRE